VTTIRRRRAAGRTRPRFAGTAAAAAFALLIAPALAPPPSVSGAVERGASVSGTQRLTVSSDLEGARIDRGSYSLTPGVQTLAAGRTNHDWARLVMLYGGWPQSESNIAVFTRWMRQENGVTSWWNRNNPLNNGLGSGGGSGLGSYTDLVTAARFAADNLRRNSSYDAITAGFAASAPPAQIESAIWASPWASSHYGNGSHWSSSPVPVVQAPPDAW